MKKVLFFLIMATFFFACEEDEKITPKDYGMKTFEADLLYDASSTEMTYTQQTFFVFGEETEINKSIFDSNSWTSFNLIEGDDYNVATSVKDWDLVFTSYKTLVSMGPNLTDHNVTGVLINSEIVSGVAEWTYDTSTEQADISEAFANLKQSDISSLAYNDNVDAIGYEWKELNHETLTYNVLINRFFIVKMKSEDVYKLRFVSFYGNSTKERIIKIEYALMQ